MTNIYKHFKSKSEHTKLLAILLDPDKVVLETLSDLILKIKIACKSYFFCGSQVITT
jgi:putative glycerol-1-phosphate prenyltransferase